ncbi:hypothetical protein E4U32_005602 [Claviceps aff. humidiphila group G2b]|nr:hypothetical protein E4U32_005602 [Claviceps aff. humidiphila group G2b]
MKFVEDERLAELDRPAKVNSVDMPDSMGLSPVRKRSNALIVASKLITRQFK